MVQSFDWLHTTLSPRFYPVDADTSKVKGGPMPKRKKFSSEFKREAGGLGRQPGAQLGQVARDIGVGAGIQGRCRPELEAERTMAFSGSGVPASWLGRKIGKGDRPGTDVYEPNEEKLARVYESLRQFVSRGGTLYASDLH